MKYFIFVVAFVCGVVALHGTAPATTCSVPNVFTNGTPANANQVNANFASLVGCGNSIDNTNIGTAGIFASQILPTSLAQATFGGAFGYTFSNGLTSNTLNVTGLATFGNYLSVGPLGSYSPSNTDLIVSRSSTGGVLVFAQGNATLDYGVNNTGVFTFNHPVVGTSNSTNDTYIPPVYNSAGGPTASTMHGVIGMCTFVGSSVCTVTLSGAAVFTSSTTYSCNASIETSVGVGTTVIANNLAASSFVLQANTALNTTANYVCIGA